MGCPIPPNRRLFLNPFRFLPHARVPTKDSPMKKLIIRGGAVIVLLLVVVVAVAFFALNPIVKNLVESQGSAGTGVATTLDSVSLRPFSGAATLNGLTLANPAGFDGEIFHLGEADVQVNTLSALSDEIVVPKVAIDGATVHVSFKDGKLNVMELVKKLQGEGGATTAEEPADDGTASTQGFVVNDLSITNTQVLGEIALPGMSPKSIDLKLADIKKTDVRGAELKDIINFVVETIMLNAANGLGDQLPSLGDLTGDLEGMANEKLDDLKGQLGDKLGGNNQVIDDALGGAEKKLGGFLDGLGKKKEEAPAE